MAAAVFASGTVAHAVTIEKPKGVVELFTSQGCYSCPPADKLIGKFAKSNEILGLSLHVDYWDYLGWKDTFASADNTQRQYSYARALRERQVYTPQAVINGRVHAVGSHEGKIVTHVDAFNTAKQGLTVPIDVSMTDESLNIKVEKNALVENATLYMVFFNKVETVKIDRGENGGKTLNYHNVVHRMQPMGLVKKTGFDMDYPVVELVNSGFDGCALILQKHDASGNPGAILGAVVLSDL